VNVHLENEVLDCFLLSYFNRGLFSYFLKL